MNKKKIISILIALALLYVVAYALVEFPIDCFPTIGPKPILRTILETFFRTKCVTM